MHDNRRWLFYTTKSYWQDLLKRINNTVAHDQVFVMAMTFNPDEPIINEVIDSLCDAAKRQVKVHLIIDARTFLVNHVSHRIGPLWYRKNLQKIPKSYRSRYAALRKLEQAGGLAEVINFPERRFKNPLGGRSHLKATIVNDYIYIGGCNLDNLNYIDVMIGINDKKMADKLTAVIREIIDKRSVKEALDSTDMSFLSSNGSQILIDAGIKNQSSIYSQALNLIDSAQSWIYMTCQYVPHGKTVNHLIAAHNRGVKVKVVYNHPSKLKGTAGFLHALSAYREYVTRPSWLFEGGLTKSDAYLHSKLLATDQGTIIGSHNLVGTGVLLGTAEIAVFNKTSSFAEEALQTIQQQLSQ